MHVDSILTRTNTYSLTVKELKSTLWTAIWGTTLFRVFFHSLWVRSLGRPWCLCCVSFFQDKRVQIVTHARPGRKKTPHTGVDPGKLYERTLRLKFASFEWFVTLSWTETPLKEWNNRHSFERAISLRGTTRNVNSGVFYPFTFRE